MRNTQRKSWKWILAGVVALTVAVAFGALFLKDRPVRLHDRLPVRSNDIVLFGDSHFEFFSAAEMLNDKRIRNKGYSGQTSADMLLRVDEIIGAKPKKVLLWAGANDAFQGRSIEDYLKDMEKLTDLVRSNAGSFVVLSIPPTTDRELQERFNDFNKALKAFCDRRSISLIDIVPALERDGMLDPQLTYDGVHLNTEGYKKILPLLKPFIQQTN